ncbi:MAG: TIM barrel protein [bacterium]
MDEPAVDRSVALKILIDPSYVNFRPFHLLPRIVFSRAGWSGFRRLAQRMPGNGIGPFPRWAFGPEGFDGLDLGISYTRLLRPDLTLRERVLEGYRKARWPIYAFHATFPGGSPFFMDTALDLGENSERTRRGLRSHIRAAAEIGGKGTLLVVHLGAANGSVETAIRNAVRLLETGLPLAQEQEVVLALENMPRPAGGRYYLGGDYADLKKVLAALPSPWLKVCFDWGHANNYAGVFARLHRLRAPDAYVQTFGYGREMIRELGLDIVYAHVHYNRSHTEKSEKALEQGDEHMPLTRVLPAEWDAFCDTLRLLMRETSIRTFGRVNLELIPRRIFGFYPVFPRGSSLAEQLSSVKTARSILEQERETAAPV